jgi:hypothetical protein
MRIAGLVEARPSRGAGTPYGVTDWARRGIGPLAAASYCERVHMAPRSAPVTPMDIEAAFLLATPLASLSTEVAGSCQLEVEAGAGGMAEAAGVQVTVEAGRVASCVSQLDPRTDVFVAGSAAAWFMAVRDGGVADLRFGGGTRLAEELVTGLHDAFSRP